MVVENSLKVPQGILKNMNPEVFFWSNEVYESLSNFTPVKIVINQKEYASVEHYYQSKKSEDPGEQELIRQASTAYKSKKLGSKVKFPRADWDSYKIEVMTEALRLKFAQEPFKSLLLSTGEANIYEDSPYDLFWGTGALGSSGTGQNHLGKLLMKIRSELN